MKLSAHRKLTVPATQWGTAVGAMVCVWGGGDCHPHSHGRAPTPQCCFSSYCYLPRHVVASLVTSSVQDSGVTTKDVCHPRRIQVRPRWTIVLVLTPRPDTGRLRGRHRSDGVSRTRQLHVRRMWTLREMIIVHFKCECDGMTSKTSWLLFIVGVDVIARLFYLF